MGLKVFLRCFTNYCLTEKKIVIQRYCIKKFLKALAEAFKLRKPVKITASEIESEGTERRKSSMKKFCKIEL